jgi:predicted Abi (CAAX) family protease
MRKMKNVSIYKSVIFYGIGVAFLFLSIFISDHVKFSGNFATALPIVLPMVFAIVFTMLSALFMMNRNLPWFFRTGFMSLVSGLTMFLFGFVSFALKTESLLWGGSLGIGILLMLAAVVRLLIQGGLSAYRKTRN